MLRPVGSPILAVPSPDDEDDRVAQVLEVLHLAQQDGVAQVEVGRGGVEADLDHQGAARVSASVSRSLRSSSRMSSESPFLM